MARALSYSVRDNPGGYESCAEDLMQYISKKPFQVDQCIYRRAVDTASDTVADSTTRIECPLVPLKDNPLRFNGTTILLAGEVTGSAAVSLAAAFQCFGVGPVVGSETGGATVCHGNPLHIRLPRTGQ